MNNSEFNEIWLSNQMQQKIFTLKEERLFVYEQIQM